MSDAQESIIFQTIADAAAGAMSENHMLATRVHDQQMPAQGATAPSAILTFNQHQQLHFEQQQRQLQQQQHLEQQQLRVDQQQQLQQQLFQIQQQQLHRQQPQLQRQQLPYERQSEQRRDEACALQRNALQPLPPQKAPRPETQPPTTSRRRSPLLARTSQRAKLLPGATAAAVATKPAKPLVAKLGRRTVTPDGHVPSARAMAKTMLTLPSTASKYKAMRTVSPADWRVGLQKACKMAFARLRLTSHQRFRDAILKRIENGASVDAPAWAPKCFLVERDNPKSTSPFQLQVMGVRILAQKTIYAAYHGIPPVEMGTWQVQQCCRHSNGSWWCFEPSHLENASHQTVPDAGAKRPMPRAADATFVPRNRQPAKRKHPPPTKSNTTTTSSPSNSPAPEDPAPQANAPSSGHIDGGYLCNQPTIGYFDEQQSQRSHSTVAAQSALQVGWPQLRPLSAQSVASQQQPVAFADLKASLDFPAVSLAELLSGPQSLQHDVGSSPGSKSACANFDLPQMSGSTPMAMPGLPADRGANGEPAHDGTGAAWRGLLDVLQASLA